MEFIQFISQVHSPLKEIGDCPLQENEGAPQAIVSIDEKFRPAIAGLKTGQKNSVTYLVALSRQKHPYDKAKK